MRYNNKRYYYEPYLMHYGVKGMKWGVRHDYEPVGRESKSKSKSKSQQERRHLTAKQKRYIKIGLAVTGTTLAAYGGYKLYQSGILQNAVASRKASKQLYGDIGDFVSEGVQSASKSKYSSLLGKVNPNRGNPNYDNNCTYCAVATYLRSIGRSVEARDTGRKPQILGGVADNVFKNPRIIDGSAGTFGKSVDDASNMLVKKFGNNAAGAVGINFKNGKGHTFNFFIDDGVVTFVDGQDIMSLVNTGRADMDKFWRAIDSQGALTLVRFDNAEIIEDAVRKVVYE